MLVRLNHIYTIQQRSILRKYYYQKDFKVLLIQESSVPDTPEIDKIPAHSDTIVLIDFKELMQRGIYVNKAFIEDILKH